MNDFLARVAALSPKRRTLLQQWLRTAQGVEGNDLAPQAGVLLPLQRGSESHRPPLFCIHAAGGQVRVYSSLVSLFGPAQSVYGVQSRALASAREEATRLAEMGAEYANAVRTRQPKGPYRLMGWSMGGVLAHSMAQELERQGQAVAFVGLVDSHVLSEGPSADSSNPMLGPALALGNAFVTRFLALDASEQERLSRELVGVDAAERLRRAIAWGREHGLVSGELSDATLSALHQRMALVEHHERLLKEHRPGRIQAPLVVFWARKGLRDGQPGTDWRKYTSGPVWEEHVEGDHFDIIRLPGCRPVAAELGKRLSHWETEGA